MSLTDSDLILRNDLSRQIRESERNTIAAIMLAGIVRGIGEDAIRKAFDLADNIIDAGARLTTKEW